VRSILWLYLGLAWLCLLSEDNRLVHRTSYLHPRLEKSDIMQCNCQQVCHKFFISNESEQMLMSFFLAPELHPMLARRKQVLVPKGRVQVPKLWKRKEAMTYAPLIRVEASAHLCSSSLPLSLQKLTTQSDTTGVTKVPRWTHNFIYMPNTNRTHLSGQPESSRWLFIGRPSLVK
jgi:hypothetical protein